MRRLNLPGTARKRLGFLAAVAVVAVLPFVLPAVLGYRSSNPVGAFRTIQPGMSYREVQAILAQPHVAAPLARSFMTPCRDAEAALRGEPSFEKREWGRVDNPSHYEPEHFRIAGTYNGRPASTPPRKQYVVRQWGVANTQSYSFIAIFDEDGRVVCRYWSEPSESRFRRWVRQVFRF